MATKTKTKPVAVEKEMISQLRFPKMPIERNAEELRRLKNKLRLATTLGNVEHAKITILFEDDEGLKKVYTTIWATARDNIVLKSGTIIPIRRIHDIII